MEHATHVVTDPSVSGQESMLQRLDSSFVFTDFAIGCGGLVRVYLLLLNFRPFVDTRVHGDERGKEVLESMSLTTRRHFLISMHVPPGTIYNRLNLRFPTTSMLITDSLGSYLRNSAVAAEPHLLQPHLEYLPHPPTVSCF
jgi:hypothetical protein